MSGYGPVSIESYSEEWISTLDVASRGLQMRFLLCIVFAFLFGPTLMGDTLAMAHENNLHTCILIQFLYLLARRRFGGKEMCDWRDIRSLVVLDLLEEARGLTGTKGNGGQDRWGLRIRHFLKIVNFIGSCIEGLVVSCLSFNMIHCLNSMPRAILALFIRPYSWANVVVSAGRLVCRVAQIPRLPAVHPLQHVG